jgi:hypothetical protein
MMDSGISARARRLVLGRRFVRADAFIRHVAATALDAVVNAIVASGTESLIVISGYVEGRAQLFVKAAEVSELVHANREFGTVVSEKKLLVTRIPEPRKPALKHDAGNDSHLIMAGGGPAQLRAAAVLLDADHSTGTPNKKTLARQRLHLRLLKQYVHVPHSLRGYEFLPYL